MNITLSLVNHLGDEIGEVNLDTVRVAPAGTETAAPDLAGQMSQMIDRLNATLADLSLVLAMAPIEFRIAVSNALLKPTSRGIVISLRVGAMNETAAIKSATGSNSTTGRVPGAVPYPTNGSHTTGTDKWGDLFDLDPGVEGGAYADNGRLDEMDKWETLGQTWGMGDIDNHDMNDDGMNDEGGWK